MLVAARDGLSMTMNAALADTGRRGDTSKRLRFILLNTGGNFLAALSYTQCHRYLWFNLVRVTIHGSGLCRRAFCLM